MPRELKKIRYKVVRPTNLKPEEMKILILEEGIVDKFKGSIFFRAGRFVGRRITWKVLFVFFAILFWGLIIWQVIIPWIEIAEKKLDQEFGIIMAANATVFFFITVARFIKKVDTLKRDKFISSGSFFIEYLPSVFWSSYFMFLGALLLWMLSLAICIPLLLIKCPFYLMLLVSVVFSTMLGMIILRMPINIDELRQKVYKK